MCGDRAVPCVRAVEAHDGKGLLVQAALQSHAVAGSKTARGHWCLPDDVGAGMIWTVCPGFSPLPNRVSDGVGVDRLVQRARYILAELRLLMIRAYEAPMDARVPCGQCPQQGRPRAGRRCAVVVTMRLRVLSGRRAVPGRFFLKIWCP